MSQIQRRPFGLRPPFSPGGGGLRDAGLLPPSCAGSTAEEALPDGGKRTCGIAIVDPRPADYAAVLEAAQKPLVQLWFLVFAREAIRLARTESIDLWVVNTVLPDFSGLDLCRMLRGQCPGAKVFLVAERYCRDEELAVRRCGAALYGCKPVRADWFECVGGPGHAAPDKNSL